MVLYVQEFEDEGSNGNTVYEVFERQAPARDRTLVTADERDEALAAAGNIADPGEPIREFPEQQEFDTILPGVDAAGETVEPEAEPDTGGGFFSSDSGTLSFEPPTGQGQRDQRTQAEIEADRREQQILNSDPFVDPFADEEG